MPALQALLNLTHLIPWIQEESMLGNGRLGRELECHYTASDYRCGLSIVCLLLWGVKYCLPIAQLPPSQKVCWAPSLMSKAMWGGCQVLFILESMGHINVSTRLQLDLNCHHPNSACMLECCTLSCKWFNQSLILLATSSNSSTL